MFLYTIRKHATEKRLRAASGGDIYSYYDFYNVAGCRAYFGDYIVTSQSRNGSQRVHQWSVSGRAMKDNKGRHLNLHRLSAPIPLYARNLMDLNPHIFAVVRDMERNLPDKLKSRAFSDGDVEFSEVWMRSPLLGHTLLTIISNLDVTGVDTSGSTYAVRRGIASVNSLTDAFTSTPGYFRDSYQAEYTRRALTFGLPLIIQHLDKINIWGTNLPGQAEGYGSHGTTGLQVFGGAVWMIGEARSAEERTNLWDACTPCIRHALKVCGVIDHD